MLKAVIATLIVTSSAFGDKEMIPSKYTCNGKNINPPLSVKEIPEGTKTLALIVEDPDAPSGTWDHWVVWNIPASKNKIEANSIPGIEGLNSFKKHHYGGPCPPSGTHRYFFKVYALDIEPKPGKNAGKIELMEAMEGHILAKGELIGLYKKSSK